MRQWQITVGAVYFYPDENSHTVAAQLTTLTQIHKWSHTFRYQAKMETVEVKKDPILWLFCVFCLDG